MRVWLNDLRERCQCCAQGKDEARQQPKCCAAGNCCRQVASEWTVHQAWTVLRSLLSEAMREELVTRNVAGLVRVPVPRARKRKHWSVDEARRFLESARSNDDPMYAGYVLMLVLGLRRGELLGLAWDDLDLRAGEARIAWQVQRIGGQLVRRQTKTHSSDAPLPLPEICVQALEHRRRTEKRLRLAAGEAWAGTGLVLTTRLGDAIDPRNFQRAFRSSVRRADVPVIPVHSTRRTCASLLVALDVHPRVAMAILRHSKIAVTMDIYSQVSAASTREALKRLGEAFL
ncbi:site-specific integrase [Knoellia sp. p5-6-4]|uniref:tyrosine-type recombinase/integrase n=1 Tax=unclassified Knoellia TaxID=2618719 RepID=UPI0023DAFC98|nr:site-specific integrase [Knoellia sp. p5-6-4]MDF2145065.1 site-specific integrase [Knoellia sp. p5-6-4]